MSRYYKTTHLHQNAGFSLVEILVALVIGLFLLGGAIAILIRNQQNYRHNDDFGRLQENARFALELLTGDLRRAGPYGCSKKANNLLPSSAVGDLFDITYSIDGLEQDTGIWAAQGNTEIVDQIKAGTDAITIRGLRNGGTPINANMSSPTDVIKVPVVPVAAGAATVIYDCEGAELFIASAVTTDTIAHGALSRAFTQTQAYLDSPDPDGLNANTFVAAYSAARYFIKRNPNTNIPGLWREVYDGANFVTQELVEGVENMQILYGVDTDFIEGPDTYARADAVSDWHSVVGVKLTLLLSTLEEYGIDYVDDNTYDVYSTPDDESDDVGPFNDRRTRKLVSAAISLRNLQAKKLASE